MGLKKSSLGALAALAMGAVVAFGVPSSTLLSLLTQSIIYAVFALGVGVLLKQNGMVSFGHALFLAVPVTSSGSCCSCSSCRPNWPFW